MQDDKINEDDFEDLDFEDFEDDDLGNLDDLNDDDASGLDESDDDLIAEDLGDDFPDDDDFTDENWDDDDMAADTAGASKTKGRNAKLSSKIILPLAVGVVVIGAGGFYLMQGTGSAPQPQMLADDMMSAESGLDITENSLPMPSPMASPVEEEFGQQDIDNIDSPSAAPGLNEDGLFDFSAQEEIPPQDSQAGTFADNEVLTPMPGLQDTAEESIVPLESLGLEEASDTIGSDIEEEPTLLADIETAEITATDDDAESESAFFEPPEILPEEPSAPSPDIGLSADPEPDTGFDFSEAIETSPPDTPQETTEAIFEPAAPEVDISAYEERINALETNLNEKNDAISGLNAEIEALKEQLSAREAALQDAQRTIAAQESRPSPATRDSSTAVAQNPVSPPPTAKPTPKPASSAEIRPKWELRAAQPGRAYIGIVGSKDVQVVETGDTLQGIGRIESIAIEQGIWVVKGSNGVIKQ